MPAARPKICKAGSTNGNRNNANASLPIGNEASRNAMLTSLVTPTGADQDQALDQLGELVGELHRHAAAERMTDHRDSLDIEDRKQVSHPVGVRRDRVVRPRLIRLPWPSKSTATTVNRCASLDCTVVQVVELSPIPWISRITGPEPRCGRARR